MASEDDVAYRKSVRNMIAVLAAIVVTVFATIFIPPYLNPQHDVFLPSTSYASPVGFTMRLTLNSTAVPPSGRVLISGWVNSSSPSIENITAAKLWALPQSGLWGRVCTSGWPIGVGVMAGHYTQDNYTLGSLIPIPQPLVYYCPAQISAPPFFLLEPHSSKALVTVGGTPYVWVLQTELSFRGYPSGSRLAPGAYTAVLADEWGDVLTANFRVT